MINYIMENKSISIYENTDKPFNINARILWKYTKSKQQFADWIKYRIEKYNLEEGIHFEIHCIFSDVKNIKGGRKDRIDYFLTTKTAKRFMIFEIKKKKIF